MSKQFAEFKINDFFEWDNGVRLNTNERIPGEVPFFTAGSENRGLYGYISNNLGAFHKPITIDMFGNCFYHPFEKCYGDDNVYFLERECSSRVKLYICTVISKSLQKLFSYATQFRKEQLRQLTVELPVTDASANTDTPEPDWEYMENYIKTIEQKFIDQVAGLNAREQKILQQLYPEVVSEKPEAHGFEKIRAADLFEITPTKKPHVPGISGYVDDKELLTRPGRNPYIVATASNNGIKCWTSVKPENKSGAITISTTADSSNTIFYQPAPFVGRQQIAQIRKKEDTPFTKRTALYVMTLLRKHTLYSNYGNKLTKEELENFELQLPITPAGDIDWKYMEKYIAWIETQERENRKLRTTREKTIMTQLINYQ